MGREILRIRIDKYAEMIESNRIHEIEHSPAVIVFFTRKTGNQRGSKRSSGTKGADFIIQPVEIGLGVIPAHPL